MRVFLNYRNGDGEDFAAMLDREMSTALGSGNVFRSSKSIGLGEEFARTLLANVRRCDVLVAVIGDNWSRILAERAAGAEVDWVRAEIVEAFEHGVAVVPFYVGRVEPLKTVDLPAELARLGGVQGIVFDHRAPGEAIGRLLAHLGVSGATSDPGGKESVPRVGVGSVRAGKANVVGKVEGPVHFGSGDIVGLPGRNVSR
jgi:hypothetical protein